jgi:hypothetical protein
MPDAGAWRVALGLVHRKDASARAGWFAELAVSDCECGTTFSLSKMTDECEQPIDHVCFGAIGRQTMHPAQVLDDSSGERSKGGSTEMVCLEEFLPRRC